MTTDYNKKHHLQLLKERSMGRDVNENQLSDYDRILESQIEWEMRDQYMELMEGVLNGNISGSEFFAELRTKNYSIIDTFEFLVSHQILLSPHKKASKFGELLEPINDLLEGEELYFSSPPLKPGYFRLNFIKGIYHASKPINDRSRALFCPLRGHLILSFPGSKYSIHFYLSASKNRVK